MKRFLCFALVMLMCLGGQALAVPQWQNAEPVKVEDLPKGVEKGLLEMNPNANTLTLLVWQPLEETLNKHVPEASKDYAAITTIVTQEQVPLACFEITSMSKGTTDTMTEPYQQTVDAYIALAAGDTGAVLPTAAQLGLNASLEVKFLHHGQLSGPAEESESNSRTYWICVYGDRGTWSAERSAGDDPVEGTWESPTGWVAYTVDQLIQ